MKKKIGMILCIAALALSVSSCAGIFLMKKEGTQL